MFPALLAAAAGQVFQASRHGLESLARRHLEVGVVLTVDGQGVARDVHLHLHGHRSAELLVLLGFFHHHAAGHHLGA